MDRGTCNLPDLSGLENLIYIGRELHLIGETKPFVRGSLVLRVNGGLRSVTEMSSLEHVGGSFPRP